MPKKSKVNVKEEVQQSLPGTESEPIPELEAVAPKYVNARDKRQLFGAQEASLKKTLIGLLRDHGLESYQRNGFDVRIVTKEEGVRVRIGKQ